LSIGTFDLGIDYYQSYIKFMQLRYLVTEVIIDPRKLTDYALDPENPKGKDKAVMFERHLGYTKDNYQLLLDQIYDRVLDAEAIPQNEDKFGMRYQIDLEIQGVESQQIETVRTGWLIPPNSQQARLITLYISKR
jgi:hypothetical protein